MRERSAVGKEGGTVIATVFKNSAGDKVEERRGVGDSCEGVTSEELEASVDIIIRIL